MAERLDSTTERRSENQRRQQQLVEAAQRAPGVSQALAAYNVVRPYMPVPAVPTPPQVRFKSGGNS